MKLDGRVATMVHEKVAREGVEGQKLIEQLCYMNSSKCMKYQIRKIDTRLRLWDMYLITPILVVGHPFNRQM